MQSNTVIPVHTGCPSYIRATLRTASLGGSGGYESAGYVLGRDLETQVPLNIEDDDWIEMLESVNAILDDDGRLSDWLATTYPRIWSRVPARRRGQFVAGVRRGRLEEQ